ncbi:MAG: succinate dehydrogenase iron-sulfur subunit [Candidatus Hydrogenedentota bacterium]|mgnify:CR=1 FL=1|jgi:succinate dehydrogenase / fumarate reductase iron-sulfur subunit|uniref:succinate dehydrogenase n=1 Tax=Sumerlaea chitinivorans TaxID=2250252 RepID=A0A2Z4Y302_SUMC1|nr:Succinate dehydrogenase iron-sulfur protein [Candidatus Sumerlaea chitinivorans]RMH28071.1 MAG: succinate dehydrogenase iron-sulfur subunit [Candidatus Hydrogenedentota bacterium]GIX45379.1 MAG: succinate dehydrogenase iron-sulfur subunit [Candidatus Sumerlaea sp.]
MTAAIVGADSTSSQNSQRTHIRVVIQRQDDAASSAYWQRFRIPYRPQMNVISVLQEIQLNPVTEDGQKTTPVVWDCNCLEEVCGACSMLINGKPRQACSALVDKLPDPIVLQPLSKFPVIRDLVVDRSFMFESLKRVKAWIPIDGMYDIGPGPRMAEEIRERMYELAKCMTCGCCLEACPQVNARSNFIGPAAISQVRLFNSHPTGKMHASARLEALMGPGGLHDCGNAQNCVQVCPKNIPLTDSIADMGRAVTAHAVKRLLDF